MNFVNADHPDIFYDDSVKIGLLGSVMEGYTTNENAERYSIYFLLKAAFVVGSGGLIFGYDIGVISGALGQVTAEFDLTNVQQGLVVSSIYLGAVFGCSWGGMLSDYIGRWKTIHIQNIIFILGAIIIAVSKSIGILYFGRFVVGIAAALSGIADVPYLMEISPSSLRGRLTSMYEILVCVGVLASFCVDLALSGRSDGWRLMFGIPAILALLQSAGMMLLPESPKWLAEKGRVEEANMVWARM